jgi:hypothetical protein
MLFLSTIGAWIAGFNLKTIAQYLLVGTICFAAGNYFASQRAVNAAAAAAANATAKIVDHVLDRAAREQAVATGALIEHEKKQQTAFIAEIAASSHAADHARRTVRDTEESARRDLTSLRSALATERVARAARVSTPTKPEIINACPSAVPFSLPGSVRVRLDTAAGAITATDRNNAAITDTAGAVGASGNASASSAPPDLSIDELAEGYGSLGQHDRVCVGKLTALQDWIRERLEAPR